jgi:peptide/nickel transport system substrate-binding protein
MRRLVAAGLAAAMLVAACGQSSAPSASTAASAAAPASAAASTDAAGSTGTESAVPVTGGTLTVAWITAAQPWDLKDAGLGHNTFQFQPVYDQLFRLDAAAEIKPNLATEWTYDTALTTLTVKLRTDVKFTDGTAFNAEAVKANLMHTKTGANEAANGLKAVTSVDVVDEFTAAIHLSAPDPSFTANLGSTAGMMASPKAIEAGSLATAPVGSGPYTLDTANTVPDSKYIYVRNPDYWNKAAFPFDSITAVVLQDSTAVLNALQAGQVDGAYVSDPKNVDTLKSAGLNILSYPSGDVQGLYIWDRAGTIVPALKDPRVRQAMNYAFDRAAILDKVLLGQGTVTSQLFNPDSVAFDASYDATYTYDPAKAKQLLADAGFPNGFEITMPDLSAFNAGAQAAVVEQLRDIGITVKLDADPLDQVINDLLKGKYPASFFQLASFRPWDTIQLGLTRDALWNPFKYDDPALTDLISKAQMATGAEQDALFKQINKYTVDQAYNVAWNYPAAAYAYSSKIKVVTQTFAIEPFLYDFSPAQ